MIVGVAKEIKNNEFRVGMTPSGVEAMRRAGHTVLIEESAGVGSGGQAAAKGTVSRGRVAAPL